MLAGATRVRPMVAGTGVIGSALRGAPAEQSLFNASRPVSAITSSSSLTAKATGAAVLPRQADCEFSGVENELVMEAGEPVTRVIFGGVPSFQEAKEATAELKEALDEMYLSPPISCESETSLIPGFSLPMNTEIVENRSRLIMEKETSSPGPKHALQAFRLLSYNTEVQTVVASIASDPNVFNAVLENPEVKQFILANRTSSDTFEDEANVTPVGESGAAFMEKLRNLKTLVIKMVTSIPIHLPNLFGSSAAESASGSDLKENAHSSPIYRSLGRYLMGLATMKEGKSGTGFMGKLRNLKNSVVDMASNIPNYLPNLFGSSTAESASGSDHKGNTQSSPTDWSLGTSFIGLAIMVIMVVLFKRV